MINRQIRSGNQAARIQNNFAVRAPNRTKNIPFDKFPARKPLKDRVLAFQAMTRFSTWGFRSCEGLPQGCSRFPYCLDLYRLIGCFTNLLLWRLKVGNKSFASFFCRNQETVGRFEIDGREGDHLPDRPKRPKIASCKACFRRFVQPLQVFVQKLPILDAKTV